MLMMMAAVMIVFSWFFGLRDLDFITGMLVMPAASEQTVSEQRQPGQDCDEGGKHGLGSQIGCNLDRSMTADDMGIVKVDFLKSLQIPLEMSPAVGSFRSGEQLFCDFIHVVDASTPRTASGLLEQRP